MLATMLPPLRIAVGRSTAALLLFALTILPLFAAPPALSLIHI